MNAIHRPFSILTQKTVARDDGNATGERTAAGAKNFPLDRIQLSDPFSPRTIEGDLVEIECLQTDDRNGPEPLKKCGEKFFKVLAGEVEL